MVKIGIASLWMNLIFVLPYLCALLHVYLTQQENLLVHPQPYWFGLALDSIVYDDYFSIKQS